MSRTDVLVAIPVIPLLPMIATWFLPWEDWLPRKVPKLALGPYFFYAAFAAWHFRFGHLTVILVTAIAAATTVAGVCEKIAEKTSYWPQQKTNASAGTPTLPHKGKSANREIGAPKENQ